MFPLCLDNHTEDYAVCVVHSLGFINKKQLYLIYLTSAQCPNNWFIVTLTHYYSMKKHLFFVMALCLSSVMAFAQAAPQTCCSHAPAKNCEKGKKFYVFSYFKGNGEGGLHLAGSTDGLKWKAFKNDESFLKPELSKDKLMRDPCIIKGHDGKYHMVWTVSWTDKGLGYASSEDLISWSEQQYIPVMAHEEGARNTWAPEITLDRKSVV